MKAIIKTKILKTAVKTLVAVADEIPIHADEEGIHIVAVDPSHVAMIKMDILKKSCIFYECEKEDFTIDVSKINAIFGLVKEDKVDLSVRNGILEICFGNIKRTMGIMDITSDPKQVEIDYDVDMNLDAGQLARAIKAGQKISNAFRVSVYQPIDVPNNASARILMDDKGEECEVKLDTLNIMAKKSAVSQYPVDYFEKLIKAIPSDTTVELGISTDMPISVIFGLDQISTVRYLLAPRIEE